MANLVETIKEEQSKTLTLNGATAYNSTGSALLDLFSVAGSLRGREGEVAKKFTKAYAENHKLATKLVFYTRDIKEGLGERKTSRIMLETLANLNPECLKANLKNLVNFGRWDDLVYLLNTGVKEEVVKVIGEQLTDDLKNMNEGKSISLLAKWLPSINTSSKNTRKLAKELIQSLELTEREYRKILSQLRAYLNVTEVRLTEKNYGNIVYSAVPSLAMNKYRGAFKRNDKERFSSYLESVKKGEAKINASTLFPYDIVGKYMNLIPGYCFNPKVDLSAFVDPVLEEQWKSLPNFVEEKENVLVMADTSGSMLWGNGRPLATSIGLAIYFAERNSGIFKGHFLSFSQEPRLEKVTGETLLEKIAHAENTEWYGNTNIEAAFDLILNSAIKANASKEEMPKSIVIISDMEFDACGGDNWSFYKEMKERFEKAGYQIPQIVFWNVNSLKDTYHISSKQEGVILASGQSASVFKTLVGRLDMTPYQYMESVLDSKRYDCVVC